MAQQLTEPVSQDRDLNSLSLFTAGVVLAAVTMTFGVMIVVFFVRSQADVYWGHIGIPPVLWLTTAVLLASSGTFEAARRALARGDQQAAFRWLGWSTGFGFAFLFGQIAAWAQVLHSGVVLAKNPHSWFIFLFTGLHGLHIVLGLGGLVYLMTRTRESASGPRYRTKTRAVTAGVSLFWHYLTFLWILLFGLLLLWRR